MNKPTRGFTLIELLIVVAIIAILAAIAVPNFLEAQTRSKVSRAKTDMRTLATAMESYRIDNNAYMWPIQQLASTPWYYYGVPGFKLTSPVAYLTSLPGDVFSEEKSRDPSGNVVTVQYVGPNYLCGTKAYRQFYFNDWNNYQQTKKFEWFMQSKGPDLDFYSPPLNSQEYVEIASAYDPTNGTVSDGNIWRTGP
jgi:type II secretion system protein G